jgi:3D-(3,5/4)-trihydroxycyclohexane-1,2-dione acylhydrolase (decyclizing)
MLVGDARAALAELDALLDGWRVAADYRAMATKFQAVWDAEVGRHYDARGEGLVGQIELLGAVNEHADAEGIIVGAAGSLPGELHKLWRTRHPKQFHLEYGYSCMGYELAGGLGVKMAAPEREVYVLLGDGSYLMMPSEIVTSVQEGYKLIVVLIDNDGHRSIGALSRSLGQEGFGTRFVYPHEGVLPGDENQVPAVPLPVDLALNARSLGATVLQPTTYDEFVAALHAAKAAERTTVIHIKADRYGGVPGYEGWWDVPVAEVSMSSTVQDARREWEAMRAKERSVW